MSDPNPPKQPRRRHPWSLAITIGAVSVVLGVAAIYVLALVGPKNTESSTQTYDVAISSIDVDIRSGNIDVSTTDSDTVTVTRKQTWIGDDPPAVTEEVDAKNLKLVAQGCGFTFLPIPCGTSYEVQIPSDVAVSAQTGSGNIKIEGETAEQTLSSGSGNITSVGGGQTSRSVETGSGNVKLEGGDGKLTVDVGSGNIELNNVSGDADVSTSSGNITGQANSVASMSLDTGSGSMNLQFDEAEAINAETGSGDIEFALNSVPRSVTAETGSGDIGLTVPGSESYAVDTSTGSGEKTVDVATDPDAEAKLVLSTGSGDLTVAD